MTAIAVVVAGAGVGLGLWSVILGLRGTSVLPSIGDLFPSVERTEVALAWVAGSALTGLVVFAATGWLVAALLASGVVVAVPRAVAARADRNCHLARTEAVAVWAEMIRDNIAGAAGLEQALVASAAVAPKAIRPELRRFSGRLDRMATVDALGRLGTELDHPSADLVVVALVNAARMEARELGPLLGRLAETIRADVRMRQRVEVGRARIRTSARIVVATTVITIAFLFVFSRQLLEAYNSTAGQLWLVLVGGVFALGGWMLHAYGQIDMPERFAARSTERTTGS
jgi:Flp pilus assembly protein TadB